MNTITDLVVKRRSGGVGLPLALPPLHRPYVRGAWLLAVKSSDKRIGAVL